MVASHLVTCASVWWRAPFQISTKRGRDQLLRLGPATPAATTAASMSPQRRMQVGKRTAVTGGQCPAPAVPGSSRPETAWIGER